MLNIAEFANSANAEYWKKKTAERDRRMEVLKDVSKIAFILIIFIVTGLIGGIAL